MFNKQRGLLGQRNQKPKRGDLHGEASRLHWVISEGPDRVQAPEFPDEWGLETTSQRSREAKRWP